VSFKPLTVITRSHTSYKIRVSGVYMYSNASYNISYKRPKASAHLVIKYQINESLTRQLCHTVYILGWSEEEVESATLGPHYILAKVHPPLSVCIRARRKIASEGVSQNCRPGDGPGLWSLTHFVQFRVIYN